MGLLRYDKDIKEAETWHIISDLVFYIKTIKEHQEIMENLTKELDKKYGCNTIKEVLEP